jgi:NF-kappa-B inhibitor-interacting Ras-like protein
MHSVSCLCSTLRVDTRYIVLFEILFQVTVIVIGNKFKESENTEFDSTLSKATAWCNREKLRHFTASAMQRNSLYEAFVYVTSKLNPPPSKSTFTPLSMGRKVKDQS